MDAVQRLTRRLGLAALVLGVVTALALHAYLAGMARRAQRPGGATVVVATRDLPAHTLLTVGMLSVGRFTAGSVPPGAVTTPAEAVGQVTVAPIFSGQPIVAADLANRAHPASLSLVVPQGMRAMTVAVSPTSGVADLVQPGDHVDVLGVFTAGTQTTVDTVSQDLDVLAVGQRIQGQGGSVPTSYTTVTLAVTPATAQRLALVSGRGQLVLTLRSAADSASVSLAPEVGSELSGA